MFYIQKVHIQLIYDLSPKLHEKHWVRVVGDEEPRSQQKADKHLEVDSCLGLCCQPRKMFLRFCAGFSRFYWWFCAARWRRYQPGNDKKPGEVAKGAGRPTDCRLAKTGLAKGGIQAVWGCRMSKILLKCKNSEKPQGLKYFSELIFALQYFIFLVCNLFVYIWVGRSR